MRQFSAKLRGLSPALDGVIVDVTEHYYQDAPCLADEEGVCGAGEPLREVTRLAGMPVAPGALWVHPDCLTELSDVVQDGVLGNPYGPFGHSVQWADETGTVTCSVYERATHLHLRAQSIVEDVIVWHADDPDGSAAALVDDARSSGGSVVDLVFRMREMKRGVPV